MRRLLLVASLLTMIAQPVLALELTPRGVFRHGGFGKSAAEIATYDAASKRLFVVNGEAQAIDVLDISDIDAPKKVQSFSLAQYGGAPNSVAVKNGVVAAALDGKDKQGPGHVVFFKAADLVLLGNVEVGAMPDMVTFTPDGRYVLAANEGEPDPNDMTRDPEGAVAVIDVSKGFDKATARLADFRAFNAAPIPGTKPGRPGASFAQAAEPEYVAISTDGKTAFVTLQEVNALAVVDIASAKVTSVTGLGFKSYETCPADLSDKDGGIHIKAHAKVLGMYKPDALALFRAGGQIEQAIAKRGAAAFNLGHDEPGADSRSDDKGPEPEGVSVGELGGKPYAFVGLERDGGVMAFDLSDPARPVLAAYASTRNVELDPSDPASGDQGPEGVLFIPADKSPNGKPLLVVSYEVSGTTRIWEIQ